MLRAIELERETEQQQIGQQESDPTAKQGGPLHLNNIHRKPVGPPAPPPPLLPHESHGVNIKSLPPTSIQRRPVSQLHTSGTGNDTNVRERAQSTPSPSHDTEGITREKENEVTNKFAIPRRQLPPSDHTSDDEGNMNRHNRWSAQVFYQEGRTSLSQIDLPSTGLGGRLSLDATPNSPSKWHPHASGFLTRTGSSRRKPLSPTTASPGGISNPGFTITLIRRDPTHGSQWNVGTISNAEDDPRAIDIEISTPGYGRFADHNKLVLANLGLNLQSKTLNGHSSNSKGVIAGNETPNTQTGSNTFRRRVYMTAGSSYSHRQDSSRNIDSTAIPGGGGHSPTSPTKSGPSKLKSGYYTFASPWDGICTFVASVNGKSLKCKHMIPNGPIRGAADGHENSAVTVAELRFNFAFPPHPKDETKRGPRAAIFTQNTHRSFASGFRSRHRAESDVSSFRGRSHSDSSTDLEPDGDRLDLSLAREDAGGGLRGKSAKLGKLIVEDEGIKMLDLVVAACMGVWWRSYY